MVSLRVCDQQGLGEDRRGCILARCWPMVSSTLIRHLVIDFLAWSFYRKIISMLLAVTAVHKGQFVRCVTNTWLTHALVRRPVRDIVLASLLLDACQ